MFDSQSDQILHAVKDLVTWLDSDVVINDPEVAALFVQRQVQSIFDVPPDILIVCYPDKLQIGNKYITYPFFIEGLENMVDQVLNNLEDHRNAVVQQTQKTLFDT